MIVALGILHLIVLGLPLALILDRALRGGRLIGTSFLLGSGLIAFILLGLSLAGVPWTSLTLAASALITFVGSVMMLRQLVPAEPREQMILRGTATDRASAWVVDALLALVVIGHGFFATLAPISEWDFWAIWGLKGRVFLEHRGIDWAFLESPFNAFNHPDYPLLLPLQYVFMNLLQGGWEDRMIGLVSTAFGAAILLIVRSLFRDELRSHLLAALATLGLARIALSSWVGIAEGVLIAFIAAALLLLRRGIAQDDRGAFNTGAVMLGLAAFSKNEGISMLVAVIAALVLSEPRHWKKVLRLWPAVVIPLPWIFLRAIHALPTDLASGPILERVGRQLGNLGAVAAALSANMPNNLLFWIGALLVIALFASHLRSADRFVVVAIGIQTLFYVCAYVITPNEINWHVSTSWVRLLNQIALPLGFCALVLAALVLKKRLEGLQIQEPIHE